MTMGFELGGRSFDSRLIMGTGGFRNLELMAEAVTASGAAPGHRGHAPRGSERARLDRLAEALLEHETLDQIDAYRIAGLSEPERLPVD